MEVSVCAYCVERTLLRAPVDACCSQRVKNDRNSKEGFVNKDGCHAFEVKVRQDLGLQMTQGDNEDRDNRTKYNTQQPAAQGYEHMGNPEIHGDHKNPAYATLQPLI